MWPCLILALLPTCDLASHSKLKIDIRTTHCSNTITVHRSLAFTSISQNPWTSILTLVIHPSSPESCFQLISSQDCLQVHTTCETDKKWHSRHLVAKVRCPSLLFSFPKEALRSEEIRTGVSFSVAACSCDRKWIIHWYSGSLHSKFKKKFSCFFFAMQQCKICLLLLLLIHLFCPSL